MASIELIQSTTAAAAGTVSPTFATAPKLGFLQVLCIRTGVPHASVTVPGFTKATGRDFTAGLTTSVSIWYRVTQLGDSAIVTATGSGTTRASLSEWAFPTAAPFDVAAPGATSGATGVTSIATGNSASTAQAVELSIAASGFSVSNGGSDAANNSHTILAAVGGTLTVSYRVRSIIGVSATTHSWLTSVGAGICLATFKGGVGNKVRVAGLWKPSPEKVRKAGAWT